MVRSTENLHPSALESIIRFGRHYTHGPRKQYDQLFMFSKNKTACEALLIFGGSVYRQNGGWCWFCGKRKELLAIYKLLEPVNDLRDSLKLFMDRMSKYDSE